MKQPIAVFDAGIGSYAIVDELRRRLPKQDVLYFADRASFPYGGKDRNQLLEVMRETIAFLEGFSPSAVVMASNAPSIMVLDEVRDLCSVPLFGVFPPLRRALGVSNGGEVGIMGVRSLIESDALRSFVRREGADPGKVALINASPMVELVESGAFLFSPAETQDRVVGFMDEVLRERPRIDVLTLSSTHLPWLRPFFERARPGIRFLDPAADVVAGVGKGVEGTGLTRGLVTEDRGYDLAAFRKMLAKIGVDIPLERVRVPRGGQV